MQLTTSSSDKVLGQRHNLSAMSIGKINSGTIGKICWILGLVSCLAHIWLPTHFLTGDGPSHLYNAHILQNLWTGKDTLFYTEFFKISGNPNPNWATHIILASLMYIMNGYLAEKILLTIYLLVFVTGFRSLLMRLSSDNSLIYLCVFYFVFTHTSAMGFYNFCLGVGIFFWTVDTWLRYLETPRPMVFALFATLITLDFFSHPLPFVFSCVACGSLTVSYGATLSDSIKRKVSFIFTRTLWLLLGIAPATFFFLMYLLAHKGAPIKITGYQYRMHEFFLSNYLVNYQENETPYVTLVAKILIWTLGLGLLLRIGRKVWIHKYDGLLIALLLAGVCYKFFPDELFGGGKFVIRAQLFVYLFTLCGIAYIWPSRNVKNVLAAIVFFAFGGLNTARTITQMNASSALREVLSVSDSIKPYSVILPLNFSRNGLDSLNNRVADRVHLFSHAVEYLGVSKPLIFLENYEANTGYFPLIWQYNKNPYHHLNRGAGIEGLPPYAAIAEYRRNTGVNIDYILMWCFEPKYLQNEDFSKLYAEINTMYHPVFRSPTTHVILWGRN